MSGDAMERDKLFMAIMISLIIFLGVILLFGVAGSSPISGEQWSFSANDSLRENNVFVGDDGTFYTALGHSIYAIAADGSTKWSLDPGFDDWYDTNYKNLRIKAAAFENGNVYMMVVPSDRNNTQASDGMVMAITPDGKVAWSKNIEFLNGGSLAAVNGRLVSFHNYNMSVYDDLDGTLLWDISNVDCPVVDPAGKIYFIKDLGEYRLINGPLAVMAYDLNGTRCWSHLLSEYGIDRLAYGSTLMFLNETLCLPYYNGVIALDGNGNFKWKTDVDEYNGIYAADPDGHIYFCIRYGVSPPASLFSPFIVMLGPDGNKTTVAGPELADRLGTLLAISNGTAYYFQVEPYPGNLTLRDIDTYVVSSYDLGTGTVLWQARERFEPKTVTVDSSNIRSILFSAGGRMAPFFGRNYSIGDQFVVDGYDYDYTFGKDRSIQSAMVDPNDPTPRIVNRSSIWISAGKGIMLVDTWAYNFKYPDIYNESVCAYAGGIFAINSTDGRTLWSRQTDTYVTSMTEKNGTVFYRTGDGKYSSASVSLAAGFAAAAFYLLFRFFMLGAVSRARSRLDKNANRNTILDFIVRNPGATLYEIAKALGINLGTVRYHLLVLSVNHKVISNKNGPKSVGYFINDRRYSAEEKLILSLMRRGQIRKLLGILARQPVLANMDIAMEMGLPESSVSRYLAELYKWGIVEKRKSESGKLIYCIVEKYVPVVASVCPVSYAEGHGICNQTCISATAGNK